MLGGGAESRADRAFERLYRRHVGEVYRYACAVLGNRSDAEDVTQTAFLNAYRAFRSGTRPDEPLNWLIAITHNVCRQRFREGSRRPREVGLDPELALEPVEDERYRSEDILRAFSQLSLNQRAALAMRELEGRSYAEIGAVLGMTNAAVETLLFRARRSFREQLEGSLTCNEAARAISLQLDGMLSRGERGDLRAHLRACPECASLARRYRAQRSAFRGVGLVPLPSGLAGGFGLTGSSAVGTAIGAKAVALGAAALVAAGVGTEVAVTHTHARSTPPRVKPVRAVVAHAEVKPAAALASAPAAVAHTAAQAVRPVPAKLVQRTSRAASRPPAKSAPILAAETTPGAPVVEPVAVQAEGPQRDGPAARQQPQLSGGGQPNAGRGDPQGLAVGHRASGPPGQELSAHASTAAAVDDRQHPAHPAHPEHPVHPEHPAHPNDPGQPEAVAAPAAAPQAEPPLETPAVTEVDATTVEAPPSDHPGNGTPPAEPPGQVKPPKPPKSGGNPHVSP